MSSTLMTVTRGVPGNQQGPDTPLGSQPVGHPPSPRPRRAESTASKEAAQAAGGVKVDAERALSRGPGLCGTHPAAAQSTGPSPGLPAPLFPRELENPGFYAKFLFLNVIDDFKTILNRVCPCLQTQM